MYVSASNPYAHQTRALEKARKAKSFALFMEQGTGKTKVAIDRCGELFFENQLTGVLVVTKKGVHAQWEGEIKSHLGAGVPRLVAVWNGKPVLWPTNGVPRLEFLCINIDALPTEKGQDEVQKFIARHKGRLMIIVDESHIIKNYRAIRTKAIKNLAPYANYRMILTGTPIAKDLTDEWSQFGFLNQQILGIRFVGAFRNEYCVMGGFENRQVIGTRNLDRFKALVEPYSFRVTKESDLDLPPKVYAQVPFEMNAAQRAAFKELKNTLMTEINGGTITAANAAVMVLRLQQITCGHGFAGDNPRLDALAEIIMQRPGKCVIWARFQEDIRQIKCLLGDKCVTYFGETNSEDRIKAVELFLDKDSGVDYFVSNQSCGGTGLNLQGECRTAIYYSNSFNAIDRWQSEDRIHRIGTTKTVTYFDLICTGSPDRKILANLKAKKTLSNMVLSDIKELLQ